MAVNLIWIDGMAKILGTTVNGVRNRMTRKNLPKPMRIGGRVCWREEDFEAWLEFEALRQGVAIAAGQQVDFVAADQGSVQKSVKPKSGVELGDESQKTKKPARKGRKTKTQEIRERLKAEGKL